MKYLLIIFITSSLLQSAETVKDPLAIIATPDSGLLIIQERTVRLVHPAQGAHRGQIGQLVICESSPNIVIALDNNLSYHSTPQEDSIFLLNTDTGETTSITKHPSSINLYFWDMTIATDGQIVLRANPDSILDETSSLESCHFYLVDLKNKKLSPVNQPKEGYRPSRLAKKMVQSSYPSIADSLDRNVNEHPIQDRQGMQVFHQDQERFLVLFNESMLLVNSDQTRVLYDFNREFQLLSPRYRTAISTAVVIMPDRDEQPNSQEDHMEATSKHPTP